MENSTLLYSLHKLAFFLLFVTGLSVFHVLFPNPGQTKRCTCNIDCQNLIGSLLILCGQLMRGRKLKNLEHSVDTLFFVRQIKGNLTSLCKNIRRGRYKGIFEYVCAHNEPSQSFCLQPSVSIAFPHLSKILKYYLQSNKKILLVHNTFLLKVQYQ